MLKLTFAVLAACALWYMPVVPGNWNFSYKEYTIEELAQEQAWVDSVYQQLTPKQRIGQLFMLPAYPKKSQEMEDVLIQKIKEYNIGGVIMFQGTPYSVARMTNRFQAASATPLMISIDGEWGLSMRLDSTVMFPRQMVMGALDNNRLVYDFGVETARQLRRVGIHINFAPVVDVNNNAKNPVIFDRSFGESRENVALKGFMYMSGLQDNGVMACAKHFPGHGDTEVDSHKDLPIINHSRSRLDSVELYPFRVLAANGLQSAMIAHLSIPALDDTPMLPSTLSKKIITDLLKNELKFEGLVFTDAMSMKGVTKYYKTGEADALALIAGIDVLLMSPDIDAAYTEIEKAIAEGRLSRTELDKRCRKILRAKYRLHLNKYKPVDLKNVMQNLNTPEVQVLKERIYEGAMTLVKNQSNFIPLRRLDTIEMASISIGSGFKTEFQKQMDAYATMNHYYTGSTISETEQADLLRKCQQEEVVVVSIHALNRKEAENFGVSQSAQDFIKALSSQKKVIVVMFGNPYALKFFDNERWVLEAYDEDAAAQRLAAQAIFGSIGMSGKLPVTASVKLPSGIGINTEAIRMRYTSPEEFGINGVAMKKSIDSIAKYCVDSKAAPGCQILVAKNNKIIYHETFGYHTYANEQMVKRNDIYDVASVTKVCATTISLMKLYEEGKINLDKPLKTYLPELAKTNKGDLVLREMLAHQSGLKAWIPFYLETLDDKKKPRKDIYDNYKHEPFTVKVTDDLYMRKDYVDTVWQRIYDSPISNKKDYVYSDLAFYLFAQVIERVSGQKLDQYVHKNFYEPMGLTRTLFNPLDKFNKYYVVPTEKDEYFRNGVVHGHVHDMGSAMIGGVSGHAGLFSSATDLAVIMQMLLNEGYYGGKRYLRAETVNEFTQQFNMECRRGLGFDKPEVKKGDAYKVSVNTAWQCSGRAFGHTGFTGTCVWADPDYDLVYIFLSNRTFPTMDNKKLQNLDIRTKIQEAIYKSMGIK